MPRKFSYQLSYIRGIFSSLTCPAQMETTDFDQIMAALRIKGMVLIPGYADDQESGLFGLVDIQTCASRLFGW